MIIAHNMLANNTIRQSDITGKKKTNATERLASGYRINRAADDAAGLSISEKMRGQIRGLTRASQNVQDGISFIQTGDGALEEVQSMLQRIRELAVQASNDTNTEDDRASIDKEVQQLKDEMDRVFNESEFNTLPIFHAPYIPDIEGMPSDFEFYNTPDGLGVAGVLINHKRYTPLELGYPTTPEHDDWELEFTDDNGELIHLKLSANEPFSKMHRIYQYEADETGIKINNLYATTWDTINQDDNIYSFSYHGMNISFTAEAGDTLDDMINKINGDGSVIKSMEAIPIGQSVPTSAVNREGGSMAVFVTNSNKNHIANWRYQMVANDYGIYNRLRPYASNPNADDFNRVPVTIIPAYEAMRSFYCDDGTAGIATETNLTVKVNPPKKLLHIQAGANAGQNIDIEWPALSNSILGIGGIKTDTFASSQYTISATDEAISMVSDVRSTFGAYQNRLEHAQNVDQNTAENLQNAESRIRDADMAKEMMAYSQSQILNDAALSMVSQANQSTQGILKLLQ